MLLNVLLHELGHYLAARTGATDDHGPGDIGFDLEMIAYGVIPEWHNTNSFSIYKYYSIDRRRAVSKSNEEYKNFHSRLKARAHEMYK